MNAIDKINTEIQDIHAKINKMKRIYDEALENLNLGGTVAQIRREMDGKYASLEVSANRILMRVGDVERGLRSELSVTAEKIEANASKIKENETAIANVEVTANGVKSTVEQYKKDTEDKFAEYYSKSEIDQKADSITMSVVREFTLDEGTTLPTENNTNAEQKTMLCKYGMGYYKWNGAEWVEYNGPVGTMFQQTSNGFRLIGDTFIEGDLRAQRLYSAIGSFYAKVYSEAGDFGLYNSGASEDANPLSGSCVWGVYNHQDGAVNMYCWGNNFLGYSTKGELRTYAKGDWTFCTGKSYTGGTTVNVVKFDGVKVDFTYANEITGLGVVPVFG